MKKEKKKMKMNANLKIIRNWILASGYMTPEKLEVYEETFDYEPVNTKAGWRKLGYFVMQNFEKVIPIPDELGWERAIRAENKYEMNATDSRGERDYVSQVRKELAERMESAEFPIAEIPLWRKVEKEKPVFDEEGRRVMVKIDGHWGQKVDYEEAWELVPTAIYARRQVEPCKARNEKSMFANIKD